MSFPFSPAVRETLAVHCGAFPRLACADQHLKRAAVAIALTRADDGSDETAFLLTRRAQGLRAHAGQWALPGGRCDPGEGLEQAALRELEEELGVRLDPGHVLGVLDDYTTRSGYAVAPVVAWVDDPGEIRPNPHEVASVHFIRLDHVSREDAVRFDAIPESDRPVISLWIGDQHIHAPTAAMIYQLRELAAGRVTRVADIEAPLFAWK